MWSLLADEPHHWTLAFREPGREAAFMAAYGREVRGFYRIAMIAVLILWSASVGLDLAAPHGQRVPLFIIRFACVTPVVLAAIVVSLLPRPLYLRAWHAASVAVFATVLAGTVALDPKRREAFKRMLEVEGTLHDFQAVRLGKRQPGD